ncbi:MAG: UDP-N-acetylglucosamine 2-epimerase (non-hydrolyzing) [Myxococcota bacterium]
MSVWVAVGTRPEAIKMAPVVAALRRRGVAVMLCTTGQHPALCRDALAVMGLAPDRELAIAGSSTLPDRLARVISAVGAAVAEAPPALVLVHGDTASAAGAALAAHLVEVPVGHVEAGLRTGDRRAPFPEESLRRLIDGLAELCFAPTALARDQLLAEGIAPERISVTGNPIVDAVASIAEPDRTPVAGRVLVTAHRRENVAALGPICDAVRALASGGASVVWPVHPNPAVEEVVRARLGGVSGVTLAPPLAYRAFVRAMQEASLILTDSGGVQEEAACLGRPTLVLRDRTERPEVLSTGVVALVGTDPARIVARATEWLSTPPVPASGPFPLGDGRAGEHVAERVVRWLG